MTRTEARDARERRREARHLKTPAVLDCERSAQQRRRRLLSSLFRHMYSLHGLLVPEPAAAATTTANMSATSARASARSESRKMLNYSASDEQQEPKEQEHQEAEVRHKKVDMLQVSSVRCAPRMCRHADHKGSLLLATGGRHQHA